MVVVFACDSFSAAIVTPAGFTASLVIVLTVVEAMVGGLGGGVNVVEVSSPMVVASTATAAFA